MTSIPGSSAPVSLDWNSLATSDFVQPLLPRHLCELCDSLLKEPLQLSCGDLFCRLCVEPYLTNDSRLSCPKCEEELDANCPAFPDNSAKKEILTKLKVYCRQKSAGCEETLFLRDKDEHESRCQFVKRPCSFLEWGCDVELAERDEEKHLASCPFRPIECAHCGESIATCKMDDHLKDVCLAVKMNCPFDCGRKELLREELNEHVSLCSLRTVPCPYQDVGCDYEGTSKAVTDHETRSSVSHLSFNHDKTMNIGSEQTLLRTEITQLNCANEELKKTMEEQAAIFRSNVDDMKRQLSDLVDKMHTVENEVYRLSSGVASPTPATSSPSVSTSVISSSSNPAGITAHQTAESQVAEESARRMSKFDPSAVSSDVVDMKREIRKIAKKISELEINQSRSSLNSNKGSELSVASTASSEPNQSATVERKLTMHDQWLKDLDLRLQICDTATIDGTLIWKITEYSKRKRMAVNGSALSLYSQPFYSSKYGYKMCCRVYLNGDGLGKGTHMSLFFSVMKGEYDSLLKWPFRQRVQLMLLDQSTAVSANKKDLVDSFRPDPKSNSFQRPTTDMNVASGCPLFVAQNVVDEGSLYKKNDVIFIKCIVEPTT